MLPSLKRIIHTFAKVVPFLSLLVARVALAAQTTIDTGLNRTAETAGLTTSGAGVPDLPAKIGAILGFALSLVGVVFLVLMVYGGFIWMTAGGEPEKIKKATAIIRNAVIGLIIVVASYAITSYVLSQMQSLTSPLPSP